ncbi:MAG TPA: DUF2231 domain-containing protein [Tepidisphaeraceae bacterium]|nr:DUF2231 domain-containing protein [Tepidisphaeraceae bacterium]
MIRFVNPNYHVILIHYPLALLSVGLLIEIFSFLWRDSTIRLAGHWMMLLGALATIPAATSGIFAKYDILSNGNGGNWVDVRQAAGLSELQWHLLNQHVLFTSLGAILASLGAIAWLATEIRWPGHISMPVLGMFLVAMGLMVAGAYNGGEIIYRTQFATRSQDQSDKMLADWQSETKGSDLKDQWQRRVEFYVDTLQTHVIAAGVLFALLAAGMGLSLQKSSQMNLPAPQKKEGEEPPAERPALAPAVRFWAVAIVAGLLTAAVGWYVTGHDLEPPLWDVRAIFKEAIWDPYRKDPASNSRMLAHTVLGGGILALGVIMLMISHWAARKKFLITLLSLLLLAMIAGQIGMGILLMYDGDSGPLTHFNPPTAATADSN